MRSEGRNEQSLSGSHWVVDVCATFPLVRINKHLQRVELFLLEHIPFDRWTNGFRWMIFKPVSLAHTEWPSLKFYDVFMRQTPRSALLSFTTTLTISKVTSEKLLNRHFALTELRAPNFPVNSEKKMKLLTCYKNTNRNKQKVKGAGAESKIDIATYCLWSPPQPVAAPLLGCSQRTQTPDNVSLGSDPPELWL